MTRKEQTYPLMGNHVFTFRKESLLIRLSSHVQYYTVTGCDSTRIAETSDNNLKCLQNIWKYTYNHSKKMRKLPKSILSFTKKASTAHTRHWLKVNNLNSLNIDFLRLFWEGEYLLCSHDCTVNFPIISNCQGFYFLNMTFYFCTNTLIERM